MQLTVRNWTPDSVRLCLERYRELCELCAAAAVGSNWLTGIGGGGRCQAYPSRRFSLLVTKWDLDMALTHLADAERAVFFLHYWAQMSQPEVAGVLGCSRQRVNRIVRRLPSRILRILRPSPRPPRLARTWAMTGLRR